MNDRGKFEFKGELPASVMESLTGIATAKEINNYNPRNWHWDSNNHLPVYVHENYFVSDPESPNGQIEYFLVSYPRIAPDNGDELRDFDVLWMAAMNLVPIQNQCEFQL